MEIFFQGFWLLNRNLKRTWWKIASWLLWGRFWCLRINGLSHGQKKSRWILTIPGLFRFYGFSWLCFSVIVSSCLSELLELNFACWICCISYLLNFEYYVCLVFPLLLVGFLLRVKLVFSNPDLMLSQIRTDSISKIRYSFENSVWNKHGKFLPFCIYLLYPMCLWSAKPFPLFKEESIPHVEAKGSFAFVIALLLCCFSYWTVLCHNKLLRHAKGIQRITNLLHLHRCSVV